MLSSSTLVVPMPAVAPVSITTECCTVTILRKAFQQRECWHYQGTTVPRPCFRQADGSATGDYLGLERLPEERRPEGLRGEPGERRANSKSFIKASEGFTRAMIQTP